MTTQPTQQEHIENALRTIVSPLLSQIRALEHKLDKLMAERQLPVQATITLETEAPAPQPVEEAPATQAIQETPPTKAVEKAPAPQAATITHTATALQAWCEQNIPLTFEDLATRLNAMFPNTGTLIDAKGLQSMWNNFMGHAPLDELYPQKTEDKIYIEILFDYLHATRRNKEDRAAAYHRLIKVAAAKLEAASVTA